MLSQIKRNYRIARLCPEIRGAVLRHSLWGALEVALNVPALILGIIAVGLEEASKLVVLLTRFLWSHTGAKAEARRLAQVKKAHQIMSPDEINERLGEDQGYIVNDRWDDQ